MLLSFSTMNRVATKNIKIFSFFVWQIKKLVILLSLGEVAEWSIAAVLKTVELRGSGGSNPSLSARLRSKKVSRNRYLLFFMPCCKLACGPRHRKQKDAACCFLRSQACKGPCGEQRGWALSGADLWSAPQPIPLSPQDHKAERTTERSSVLFLCLCV